ncbi:uncharacterized protein LOC124263673 [Haliotis rubra]|uniref:uncharacterized protein LOC124263673 n=1 Tax=Haliotis rubra TaxID=36100 RepID=UPI001EE556C9|nr:uncharacterized protein LOC124263673 [Haliotis rubra]
MDRKLDDSLQILPSCTSPNLEIEEACVNTWCCHLAEDGRLVNQNSSKPVHDGKVVLSKHSSSRGDNVSWARDRDKRPSSPFMLNTQNTYRFPSSPGLSPFSTGSDYKREMTSSYRGRHSPLPDVFRYDDGMTSHDPTSGYVSPLKTSRQRPPRLKIYPGALASSSLRGFGQRYWQVEATCNLKVHLYGLPVFEAGVSLAEAADTSGLVDVAGKTWLLRLTTCYDHPDHVCVRAVNGCRPLCHFPVKECRKNETFTLKYGFLLNFDRRELVVIDLARMDVLHVFENVDTSRDLWPVFGVFSRHRHHVQLRLVSGKHLRLESAVSAIISKMINRQTDEHSQNSFFATSFR